jgi:hypothetical protein
MWFRSPSLLQLSYALALEMRQLATTHLATARAGTKGSHNPRRHWRPRLCGCGDVCRSLLCQNYKAAPSTHDSPHTPLTCTRYHNMPPLRDHSLSRTPDAERDPCRSRTHADRNPCGSRPVQNAPHADLDSKTYASVASTTTPAPKGRDSLAQGVSPGTAPRKEPSPGGATACAPAHKHKLGLITNIDIHKYRYPSI